MTISLCPGTGNLFRFVAYADDSTHFASVPFLLMGPVVAKSLNGDLAKISAWCKLWSMKMNPTKTHCMTVGRSRVVFLPHPDLFIDTIPMV